MEMLAPLTTVSLVVPVRNEAISIGALIGSIQAQTRPPEEIVFVDGGSTDETPSLIAQLTAEDPRFRLIEAGPATPGRGRNLGIAAASHDWIALTDAGIRLEPTWLEHLLEVADRDAVDVVYGNYEPVDDTFFEGCAALAYVPAKQVRGVGRMRGPSIASALLRRKVWESVGGFPDLRAAEDLIFMERVAGARFRIGWAPAATVHWQLQPSLARTFRKFALYSKHNIWAGRQRDWHYGIARMYLAALPFLILAALHPWWLLVPLTGMVARTATSVLRRCEKHSVLWCANPLRLATVGLVLLTIDLAAFVGWVQAIWPWSGTPNTNSQARNKQNISDRKRSPATLYLCYQSLLEPLTQTQVVAYLEGLAKVGYTIVLLTFEPRRLTNAEILDWRERLAHKGIVWHWQRYHRRPSVPATAWDIVIGVCNGLRLIVKYRVRLLHARSHVPGVMALILKRLSGSKLLFDMRGLMAEEYVDAGVWPAGGKLFRLTKWFERRILQSADGVIVLTNRAKELLWEWYPQELEGKLFAVIPCCVDLRRIPAPPTTVRHQSQAAQGITLVYAGKLGGWYLTAEMAAFVATAARLIPHVRCQVWTQSDDSELRRRLAGCGLNGEVSIGCVAPEALPVELAKAQAGLSFIKPCLSKLASSATKVAEYLAAGLPVVATAGVGDTDAILSGAGSGQKPVGVLIRDFTATAYAQAMRELVTLLADRETASRCRERAEENFDLEHIGWARYRRMYERLVGPGQNTSSCAEPHSLAGLSPEQSLL